jgi:crotonobetainyl-CoA:carnitine CoA-transferase CaiB-like acyl-CoA transferase
VASFDWTKAGVLSGIRVLSFGAFVAGNTCPLALAELGADVVKIESLERPEALRIYFSVDHPYLYEPSGVQTTALFTGLARSMRSVCLDMKTQAGQEIFRDLVSKSHVVVENFGPGQMERWGCSYDDLLEHNEQLVMLSISGYGRTGPKSSYRAYASNICNFLGLTSAWALDVTHFDYVAGIHGAVAVLAGLAEVRKTKRGVFVDLAQVEAGAAVMALLYLDSLANGEPWSAAPNEVPGAWMSLVARCLGDDAWVAIELENGADWNAMCDVLERSALTTDGSPPTTQHLGELRGAIEQWAAALRPYQAATKLQLAGIAAGPVQDSEDLWRDPQLRSRGAIVEVAHPDIGVVEFPNSPDRMSLTPGAVQHRSPRLGEHSAEVLREWLHRTPSEIRDLLNTGGIWEPNQRPDDDTHPHRGAGGTSS